ncbi:MAG: hypothetical protein ACOZQL_40045 [Myxococcota bacterium]
MRRAPLLACLLALWPAAALAVDLTYTLSARTDLRLRTPYANDSEGALDAGVASDLELNPVANVTLGVDQASFTLGYTPSFIWREPTTGGRFLQLHQARLGWGQRWEHGSLLVTEEGVIGFTDVGAVRARDDLQTPGVPEVQIVGGVPYLRSGTLALLDLRPSERWGLGFSAGYQVSGTPSWLAPELTTNRLPLQWGPMASARFRLEVSRLDALSTLAAFSWARFQTGQEQLVASLSESWDRRLSRSLTLNLAAGAALTRAVVTPDVGVPGEYLEVLPVANGGVGWRDEVAGKPLRLDVSARMAPFADRFTGLVYERVEGRLGAELVPAREWVVTAGASGAVAVPLGNTTQAGDRVFGGDAAATWTIKTWLLLQASVRVLWTEQPRLGANTGQLQAFGSVSVTVRQQDSLAL